ncbi:hypothetical protein [Rhizobium leguminosarum]|uniref:hypothetical protein n=1 Tax=Rhizobium leguminosarum TaxID=384 RepID=UPI001C94F0DD|nr:hypothetical protein [Rhizobium leguminosarum]MBY5666857.1 hypothetical protein [Rhizobium leguminosarum]MBY5680478.1 hypothetical protein [Rhizobium leguminosarum]
MVSYVDPITNTAVFSQVDLRRHLVDFMKLEFPERLLPTFLHESTHHACFHSPVGATLALLRMRAYRRSELLIRTNHPDADEWDILVDVLRQEGTMEVLRPLSEGLACFTELDSIPGESNVLTTPMTSAFFIFGGRDHELKSADVLKKHGPGFFLFSLLYRARTDEEVFRRREAILRAKFRSSSGGHLAGYMTLKALWAKAKRTSDLAWDSELFSMFVRSYFYDDYGMVAKILDPTKKEHNAANAIAQYFLERMSQLFSLDWEAALQKYLEDDGDTRYRRHDFGSVAYPSPGGINSDEALRRLGMTRLDGLLAELVNPRRSDEDDHSMRRRDLSRMQKRELLCLGSLDLHVVVNAHGRVLIYPLEGTGPQEYPIYAVQALEGIDAGDGPGSVEIYLIPSEHSRASAIVCGGQVVHVHFEGPISEARQKHFTELFGSRSEDLRILGEQEKTLNSAIAKSVINFVRAQALKTIPEGVDQLYSVTATFNFPAEKREPASRKLMEGGLLTLCDEDEDFIHALAFAGSAGSVATRKAELEVIASENGIDLVEMLGRAGSIEQRTGLSTLKVIGDLMVTEL